MDGAKAALQTGTRSSKRIKEKQKLRGGLGGVGKINGDSVENGHGVKSKVSNGWKKANRKTINGRKGGKGHSKAISKPVQEKQVESHEEACGENNVEVHPPAFATFSSSALFMCFADEAEHHLIDVSSEHINFESESPKSNDSKDATKRSEVLTNGESTNLSAVKPGSVEMGAVPISECSLIAVNSGIAKCCAEEPNAPINVASSKSDCLRDVSKRLEVLTNGESAKCNVVKPGPFKKVAVPTSECSLVVANSVITKCCAVEPKAPKIVDLPKPEYLKSDINVSVAKPNDHVINPDVEPKAPRKWLSFLSGLVKEVPPPGFNAVITSPIYMYRRGPETTGQSLEEIQKAVSSGLHGRLIFLTGPVPGWGLPEMKYLGNAAQCDQQQEPHAAGRSAKISTVPCREPETMDTKPNSYESCTPQMNTTPYCESSDTGISRPCTPLQHHRRLRISEVVECKTPTGDIKYEKLKETPSLLKQAAKLKKTLLKKRKLETGKEPNPHKSDEVTICQVIPASLVIGVDGDVDRGNPVRLFSSPSVDLRLNQCSVSSSDMEEFYSSAYPYLISAFTILVYRTGLYPRSYFNWRNVFGIDVPHFPPADHNSRYLRNFTKGILASLRKKQFDGAVLQVSGKDVSGVRLTLHRYIFRIADSYVMSDLNLTSTQVLLREMTMFGVSLNSLLETERIVQTPCPWLSAWKLSVGVKGDRKSTSPDALLRKPSDALNFPWKRQRSVSQAYRMGLIYPPVHLRPKNFIANELKKLKELETARKYTSTSRRTTEGVNNRLVNQAPTKENWCYDFSSSSDEREDEVSEPKKTAEGLNMVSEVGEVGQKELNKIGKRLKKSDCTSNRACFLKDIKSRRKQIGLVVTMQTFRPRFNVVISICRRDFRSPSSVFTKERLAHASKKEKNFLKSGTRGLDSELLEPNHP